MRQPSRTGTKALKAQWRRERAVGETELSLKAWARGLTEWRAWLRRKRLGS